MLGCIKQGNIRAASLGAPFANEKRKKKRARSFETCSRGEKTKLPLIWQLTHLEPSQLFISRYYHTFRDTGGGGRGEGGIRRK